MHILFHFSIKWLIILSLTKNYTNKFQLWIHFYDDYEVSFLLTFYHEIILVRLIGLKAYITFKNIVWTLFNKHSCMSGLNLTTQAGKQTVSLFQFLNYMQQ